MKDFWLLEFWYIFCLTFFIFIYIYIYITEWQTGSKEDRYLSCLSDWQIWHDHKFSIFQSWEASSIETELQRIKKMGSLVATSMNRAKKMEFSAALMDVTKAFIKKQPDLYADMERQTKKKQTEKKKKNETETNEKTNENTENQTNTEQMLWVTKHFVFWNEPKAIAFNYWTSNFHNVFGQAITDNPVIETALVSISSNNKSTFTPQKQMNVAGKAVNSLVSLTFLTKNDKMPPTHKGLSNGRATLIHIMRYCIWSDHALQELQNNCVSVLPPNQRTPIDEQPWMRILSLSYFRLVICYVHVNFIDYLKECIKHECRVLQMIRKPQNLLNFGEKVIIPALEVKTELGYIIPVSNFPNEASSTKGQGVCNRIVFAGGHEFMLDLLQTRVSHGVDPMFRIPGKENVNLYLKLYLGYVSNCLCIYFTRYRVTDKIGIISNEIQSQARRHFYDTFS
jgi:hypothetical protein